MFSKKEAVPVQQYFIDIYPNLKELSAYTEKANTVKGMKHVYVWEDKEVHKKFSLSILTNEENGDTEWWMHEEGLAGNRMLWFYKTKDLSLIFTQMCQAVGAPASLMEDDIEQHREAKKNYEKEKEKKKSTLGDRLVKKKTRDYTAGASEQESAIKFGGAPVSEPEEMELPPAPVTPESVSQSTMDRMMSGDLRTRPIGTILDSAKRADATGHLTVEGPSGKVVIQFGLGKPVHAYKDNVQGVDAILEIFTWREGHSTFSEGIQPEAASVPDETEEILKQGESLLANVQFLESRRINEISVLQPPPIRHNEDKVIERLQDGAPLGIKVQKYFLDNVDGGQTISQIAAKANLSRCKWINIVGNLLKLGLIHTPEGESLNSIVKREQSNPMMLDGQRQQVASDEHFSANMPAGDQMQAPEPSPVQQQHAQQFAKVSPKKASKAAPKPPSFLFNRGDSGASTGGWPSGGAAADSGASSAEVSALPAEEPQPQLQAQTQTATGGVQQPAQENQIILGVPDRAVLVSEEEALAGKSRLLNKDTGIYSFDSFQYLLKAEFARAFRFGTEFTFVVFCLNISGGTVSNTEIIEIAKSVEEIIREVDHFGHFGDMGFGIILPGIKCEQATSLCTRIISDLPSKHPELAKFNPTIHFGLASVPHDEKELDKLVASAQQAMIKAVDQNQAYILAADLN